MLYGQDRNGKLVHHSDASYYEDYKCPNCFEPVYKRPGQKACFSHEYIKNRTPQQRTCPEYHENLSYSKINDKIDKLYINNGGIPLYLCGNEDERFELRAYFPSISENILEKLQATGTKIHVNTNALSNSQKATYNINNIDYYKVNTVQPWIDVNCEPQSYELEIKRKWLWGIRGIDIGNDIFHSNYEGGYRLPLKGNIFIGKSYRIIFSEIPYIYGISFKSIGEISLKKGFIENTYTACEMTIESLTNEAKGFIEGKGYKLLEKADELIPLWPPAVFNGKDLTFNQKEAIFLHIANSNKPNLCYEKSSDLIIIQTNDSQNIIKVPIENNKNIVVSNQKNHDEAEIKFNITYSPKLTKKEPLELQVSVKDSDENIIDLYDENLKLPKDGRLYIVANVKYKVTVNCGNYVLFSSCKHLEHVDYTKSLILNSGAFGINTYQFIKTAKNKVLESDVDWDMEYRKLYNCHGPTIIPNHHHRDLLLVISKNINWANQNFFLLLEKWIKTNSIPVSSLRYLEDILRRVV